MRSSFPPPPPPPSSASDTCASHICTCATSQFVRLRPRFLHFRCKIGHQSASCSTIRRIWLPPTGTHSSTTRCARKPCVCLCACVTGVSVLFEQKHDFSLLTAHRLHAALSPLSPFVSLLRAAGAGGRGAGHHVPAVAILPWRDCQHHCQTEHCLLALACLRKAPKA